MNRRSAARWPFAAITALFLCQLAMAQDPPAGSPTENAIVAAFRAGEVDKAYEIIKEHLREHPNSPLTLYNAACACCALKKVDEGAEYLLKAVKAGFRDFDHMQRDPDIACLRETEVYQAIIEARRRLDQEGSAKQIEQWKSMFGEKGYRYDTDDAHHLNYAIAIDDRAYRQMRQMLDRQADQMIASLFGEPPGYYVFIAVPTPEDAARFFAEVAKEDPRFNSPNVAGLYEHRPRRLVAKDIGATLRHEFVHLMHYGHMERLGQQHPIWIQEGLASLYEDYTLRGSEITFLPNDRTNVIKRNVKGGRVEPWEELFSCNASKFMDSAGRLYPQVRSMFEFLAAQKKLSPWYSEYVAGYAEDPTGLKAFEKVFGKPLKEIEKDWRAWVNDQSMIENKLGPGDAWIGCEIEDANDGARISKVVERLGDRNARLRLNDVITAVDDEPVRSGGEVVRMIAGRQVGDVVKLTVRRGKTYLSVRVSLRPIGGLGL